MLKDAIKNGDQKTIMINADHFHSFLNFTQDLREKLIDEIVTNQNLETQHILNLLLIKNEPSFINRHYNEVLSNIEDNVWEFKKNQIIGEEIIQFRIAQNKKSQAKLPTDIWNEVEEVNINNQKVIDFRSSINQIADLISVGQQKGTIIQICLSILRNMEQEESGLNPGSCSIKQLDFLLDLMNFGSGISDESFQFRSKIDVKRPTQQYAIVLMNFDKFQSLYPYSQEIYDFLDHLVLRCFNDTGIRNHVPIVIESSDSQFYNRDIYEMMSVDINQFFCVDVLHLSKAEIQTQVGEFFTVEDFNTIYDLLGGSLKDWYHLVQQYVQQEDFILKKWIYQKQNPKIENNKEYAKFLNQMNQVYSSVETAEQFDQGNLDKQLLEMLHIIIKYKGRLFTGRHYNDVVLMQNPIIICLQRLRILYHPKYLSELQLTNQVSLSYIIQFTKDLQQKVDQRETTKQKLIRRFLDMLPLQDKMINTDYFNVNGKKIHLMQDIDDPRERHIRDDRKGVRPYHTFLN